ncbi:hypothetical protein [Georgenia yuyongxinii]
MTGVVLAAAALAADGVLLVRRTLHRRWLRWMATAVVVSSRSAGAWSSGRLVVATPAGAPNCRALPALLRCPRLTSW